MKLATVSNVGMVTGFFDINNPNAPQEAFEISNEIYDIWVNNTNGMRWDKRSESLIEIDETILLTDYINVGLIKIDKMIEDARQNIITIGHGQSLVYVEKFDEATDYIVDDCPEDLTVYPYIKSEAKEFGVSPRIVAERILIKKSEWLTKSPKLEGIRLRAKHDINVANDTESIDVILSIVANKIKEM